MYQYFFSINYYNTWFFFSLHNTIDIHTVLCIIHTRYGNETALTITMGILIIIIMQKFNCNLTGTNEITGETIYIYIEAIIKCRIELIVVPCTTSNFFSYPLPCTPVNVVNFNHKFLNESPLTLSNIPESHKLFSNFSIINISITRFSYPLNVISDIIIWN